MSTHVVVALTYMNAHKYEHLCFIKLLYHMVQVFRVENQLSSPLHISHKAYQPICLMQALHSLHFLHIGCFYYKVLLMWVKKDFIHTTYYTC